MFGFVSLSGDTVLRVQVFPNVLAGIAAALAAGFVAFALLRRRILSQKS